MSGAKLKLKERRSHIRFSLNELHVGMLDLNAERENFEPNIVGLIADESYKGVRLVFVGANDLQEDKIYKVKVGKLAPMRAQIQWSKDLGEGVKVVGFQYLD